MRKIYMLCLIVFGLGLYLLTTNAINSIDLMLKDEIGIVFLNKNMILVLGDEKDSLLVLDSDEKIDNLNKFKYNDLDVIMLFDHDIEIEYARKKILNENYGVGDIEYVIDDGLIYINYLETRTCIYMDGSPNISGCEFVYFYNNDIKDIILSDYQELIFYHYNNPLSNKFLEKASERLIDTYQLRNDEIAVIKIGEEDYDFIVIAND